MITRLTKLIQDCWHPLWRLRQLSAYRWIQQRLDCTVYSRIPETGLRVAVKLLRDASWIAAPTSLEPEIRSALALVLDLLRPSVFWDIGANIGFYSWLVRQHSSVQQVVMFEPDSTNYALITNTIRKNAIRNCRALNIALSDRCGETTFLLDRASGATGSLEAASHRENKHSLHHAYQMAETITCVTSTIDSLITDGLPPPSLLKIDVEGAEHLVLAGAESCLTKHCPALIVETSNPELVGRLRNAGYRHFASSSVMLCSFQLGSVPISPALVAPFPSMTKSSNHALLRTCAVVTPAASCLRLPPPPHSSHAGR
jgi:FkbM family methyltransferase